MVQTRAQHRRWMEQQERNQMDQEDIPPNLQNLLPSPMSSLSFLSQNSSLPDLSLTNLSPQDFPTLGQAMYRPNDRQKKRHRLPDGYPYVETVRSYTRRNQP